MKMSSLTTKELKIALAIVLGAFLIRVIRLDVPHDWSFDEVYHAISAEAYALNDPRGYEWFNPSPKDLAWEWLHPPLSKFMMAASIHIFSNPHIPEAKADPVSGDRSFAWRFPGVLMSVATVWLLIIFGKKLFGSFWIGAVAGGLYALDGLSFVQARTAMNDAYITFFIVLVFYRLYVFMIEYPQKKLKNLLWLGIAAGLAAATKWTGFYAVGIVFIWGAVFILKKRDLEAWIWGMVYLFLLPPLIYILSYGQWWWQGHTFKQFMELHQQIWWYQTGLKATHDYQSHALTWPLLYRPVWFYVDYQDVVKNGVKTLYIGNIYSMGNPLVWWGGLVAVLATTWEFFYTIWRRLDSGSSTLLTKIKYFAIETKDKLVRHFTHRDLFLSLSIIIVGYFSMFLPWAFSPRIMFLYHYLPSVPFLCLALAYGLYKLKSLSGVGHYAVTVYLTLCVLIFIYFYPHWTALPLPQAWVQQYFWLPSWK